MLDKEKRKAQEEMVGFALIIIIVAVIILVFVSFSLRDPQKEIVESYEIESFIESFLQQTTECRDKKNDLLTVKELIVECEDNAQNTCSDGENSCELLNSILGGILEESWQVGEDRPIKGYELNISSDVKNILSLEKGVKTLSLKESNPDFPKKGKIFYLRFRAYY